MIKILLVTLITLLATQVSASDLESPICESIKGRIINQEQPLEICTNLSPEYRQYDEVLFFSTCEDVMRRLAGNVDPENMSYCAEQFKPVTQSRAAEGDALMKVAVDSSPLPPEQTTTASLAMDKCQEGDLLNAYCSIKSTFVLPELNEILKSPIFTDYGVSRSTPAVYTKDKCDCFEKAAKKSFTLEKRVKFDIELDQERKRVNDLIFNAAGKKIINAFAANLEDINFYKTNNVQAIGGDQSAEALQCTSIPDFKSVIADACNRNQIRADVIKGRTDALLGAFGDFKNQTTIEGKFKDLQEQVLNAQLDPSKLVPGGPKSYSRREYDKSRFGIYQKRDEVKFMSELTDALMDDPDLSKIINEELESGKRPGHAIFKLVSDGTNPKVTRLLSRIVKNHDNGVFYKNLGIAIKSTNPEGLKSFIMNTYDVATDMHPGLKAIFRSPELFKKTHSQMKKRNGSHDLIAELDKDPELLKTFFQKRCEGIKAQFAEALCYREEDLTSLANKEDLNKLLSNVAGTVSPVMKDAILCRMQDHPINPNSVFSKLAFNKGDKLTMADYFKRKANVAGEGPASRFEKFAEEYIGGGSNSKFLSEMSEFRSELRKPSSEYAAIDQAVENKKIEKTSINTPIQIPEKIADQPQLNQNFSNNYVAPINSQVASDKEVQVTPKDQRDPKSMLRDFLADEENKSEVERHLSNLNSKDQDELARLKQEIADDKEKILALLQESERLKLKGFEQKVTEAETNLSRTQSQVKSNSTHKNEANEDEEYSPSSNKVTSSAGAATSKEASGNSSASNSSSSSAGTSSRGSSGAQRSLASLNSSLPTVNNVSTATTAVASDKGEIIIQSSGTEDVSKEVISFVQKNEPDVETLKQLKNTGMTFKYKVLQNGVSIEKEIKVDYASLSKEAKQFLDQKIAVKEAKRNYSYNTLRLMLGLKAQKEL